MKTLLTLLLCSSLYAQAQQIISIGAGGNLYMQQDAVVYLGGFVLTPSANYNITGVNNLQKGTALNYPASGTYVQRVYTFSNALPPFTGNILFYYKESELNGLAESELTLNAYNGTAWSPYASVVVDEVNNFVQTSVTNLTNWEATLASVNAALPLQWLHIAAALKVNHVQVHWKTSNEYNVAGFVVEKRVNNIWSAISPLLPANNTNGPNDYAYSDEQPITGTVYYRVLQKDLDGKSSYSSTVSVKNNTNAGLTVFPNPAQDYLDIRTNYPGTLIKAVRLADMSGAIVHSIEGDHKTACKISVQQLTKGAYIIQVVLTNGQIIQKKFIKQ